MRELAFSCITVLLLLATGGAGAAEQYEKLYYGSKAGMQASVISEKGIGTVKAVLILKHTLVDAKAYCVGYELDYSAACVKRAMAEVHIKEQVSANCKRQTWVDMWGKPFALEGENQSGEMPEYLVRDMTSGRMLDYGMASGYEVELAIFKRLCPGILK
ncbi:hypothetical protein LZK77_16170 [Rhizobium leguminosarum]|nr:hypothetical protein LZK77_16170 [Rhizobium leguminosarum]